MMAEFLMSHNHIITVISLCIIIAMCVLAIMNTYMKKNVIPVRGITIHEKWCNRIYLYLFIAVAIVGIITRTYQFGSIPAGVHYDEAMGAVDANALAHHGTDLWGMSWPVQMQAWKRGQQSALLGTLMVPFIKFFGLNIITVRLPMLILSTAAAVCLVLLVKDIFGRSYALLTAFITAVIPWHIMQGHLSIDAYTFPHMFIIAIYVLNLGLKNIKLMYVSMALFGLCMYTYALSVFTVPLFLIVMAVYIFKKKNTGLKPLLICAAIYTVISLPFYICMFINLFKLDTINIGPFTIPRFYETQRSEDMIFFVAEPLKQLKDNFITLYNTLIHQRAFNMPQTPIDIFGFYYRFSIPLAILGVVYLVKCKKRYASLLLGTVFLCTVITGLITPSIAIWRISVVVYVVIVLNALGVSLIFKSLKAIGFASIFIYTLSFIMFVTAYFTSYKDFTHRLYFGGFGDALVYMDTFDADKYYITSSSQFDNSPDVSETYTLFYHKIDSEYFQGKTNNIGGREYPPYNERYIYSNIQPSDIKQGENAVYLVTTAEKAFFNPAKYNFKDYEGWQTNYCVVTSK